MKKTIIIILAIVIVAAVYFLLTTRDTTLVYPGAVFIAQEDEGFLGKKKYYAADASLSEVAEFYAEKLPDFELEMVPKYGYWFYNPELHNFIVEEQDMSEEEVERWIRENRGALVGVALMPFEVVIAEEVFQLHEAEFWGDTIIAIIHL